MHEAIIRIEERVSKNGKKYCCVVAVITYNGRQVEVVLGFRDLAEKIAYELLK